MQVASITRLNLLFDFYSRLLTDKQRELFELHYQYDLSLGEIGENFDVSRQAVHDLLRRTISQLENYEQRLQLVDRHHARQQQLDELMAALESNDIKLARELTDRLKYS